MLHSLLLLFLLILSGCGSNHSPDSPVPPFRYSLPADLSQKQSLYRDLVPSRQSQDGFLEVDHCDSLLLTSLLGASGSTIANIRAAEVVPGKFLRRPPSEGECYPKNSGSSISRDMLLGLMWYAWSLKDLQILEDLYEYGSKNNWVMGEGDPARTGFRTLRGTLVAAINALGGPKRPIAELFTDPQLITQSGFGAHLQALHILLRGEIYGRMSGWNKSKLKGLAAENPDSPLMQAAAARWVSSSYLDSFLKAASNTQYFPSDRLPTSADRCTDWATQQNNPRDWAPCPEENRIHSGGDLLYSLWILQL